MFQSFLKSILVTIAVMAAGCTASRSVLPASQPQTYAGPRAPAGRFMAIKHQPPVPMIIAFLMTDGTVVTESNSGSAWYRYTPDSTGDYSDGTWTQIASLQAGYAPSAFASQVLADGRLLISGGEYNGNSYKYPLQLTNLGSVYDPVANTWTPLGHPHGWKWIGDSPSSMLPDGRMLIGQKLTERDAVLDPKTLAWMTVSHVGKADFNAEEGWTLLPDGTILTADVKNSPNSEIYNPSTGTWKTAGSTVVNLASHDSSGNCYKYGPGPHDCYYPPGEIGPSILRPDGTIYYTGAGQAGSGYGTGHTAIYYTRGSHAGTWAAGPDFPNNDNAGDSYAVLEPSGNVLVFGRSGSIYEWNGKTLTVISGASYTGPPILLPTGQVMMVYSSVLLYTPKGSPKPAWAPAIKSYPKRIAAGKTYKITGTQFNGLSQAMSFGDEEQNSTNYPLVRITNKTSGSIYYARTHDHSTMGVATGSKLVWTYFNVPAGIGAGASTLQVVANGIASKPVTITVSK
jgi:hypothetical protein